MNNDSWLMDKMLRNYLRSNNLFPNRKDTVGTQGNNFVQLGGAGGEDELWQTMLVFGDSDGNYRGARSVLYDKLRMSKLFMGVTPTVTLYNPTTTREIGEALIARYGIPVKPEWVQSVPVDASVLPANIPVRFAGYGYVFDETINVRVNRASVNLTDILTHTVLDSPGVPTTILSGRTPAEYTYSVDFTPDLPEQFDAMVNYPTGVFLDTSKDTLLSDPGVLQVMEMIRARIPATCDWEVSDAGGFAMLKSALVYNGPTSGYVPANLQPWSARADLAVDNVLVIQFSPDIPGRAGLGFFHYNTVAR